jgi:hypothetical protein
VASFVGEVTEGEEDGDADGEGVGVVAQPRNVPTSNRVSREKPKDLETWYCFMTSTFSVRAVDLQAAEKKRDFHGCRGGTIGTMDNVLGPVSRKVMADTP